MKVTYNELQVLTAKAFNAKKLSVGEADRVSGMVAELEMVGMAGLDTLATALPTLESTAIDIDKNQIGTIKTDFKNTSIICHLPNILYCSRQYLDQQGSVTVVLQNGLDNIMVYAEISKLNEKGFNVSALWTQNGQKDCVQYIHNVDSTYPDVYYYPAETQDNILTIKISKTQKYGVKDTQFHTHICATELENKRNKSLENGIEISQTSWKILQEYNVSNLVENTAESEANGAGGI